MARPDWFADAFGAPVTDIRQKLVEEAWFGRTVTPRPLASDGRSEDRSMAEGFGWDAPDRVLAGKLDPDRMGERAYLGWLEAHHHDREMPEAESERSAPEHGIDR